MFPSPRDPRLDSAEMPPGPAPKHSPLRALLIPLLMAWTSAGHAVDEISVELPGGATMEFVRIQPGTFLRGSPETEIGRFDIEGPQHQVIISQGFYFGKYELTQAQWESVMETRPWTGEQYVLDRPEHPAVYISWFDVLEFIERLNQFEQRTIYRLPTEAEWEYAARAGTTGLWSFGDDIEQLTDYAWYGPNAWSIGERYGHPVGTLLPNPWGLHDVHGNVWEWTRDWLGPYSAEPQIDPAGPETGRSRVVKGGYFDVFVRATRSAARGSGNPVGRDYSVGARLVRETSGDTAVDPQSWGHLKKSAR